MIEKALTTVFAVVTLALVAALISLVIGYWRQEKPNAERTNDSLVKPPELGQSEFDDSWP